MSQDRTLADRVADELLARIFTGEYGVGERLPAERALSEELGVDRTTLRMALRQLSRMNLVRAVRGSGITVLDYRAHAGLDFLAALLDVPGLELGGAFLLEALSLWERALPSVYASALARSTPAQIATLDAMLGAQIAAFDAGHDLARIAAIGVDIQDHVIETLGDVTLRLLANSTRALRRELMRIHLALNDVRKQLVFERSMLEVARRSSGPTDQVREHAAYLRAQHEALRAHLAKMPPGPRRTSRWVPPHEAIERSES